MYVGCKDDSRYGYVFDGPVLIFDDNLVIIRLGDLVNTFFNLQNLMKMTTGALLLEHMIQIVIFMEDFLLIAQACIVVFLVAIL